MQIAPALLGLFFKFQLFNFFFELASACDQFFFALPVGLQNIRALPNLGQLSVNHCQPLPGVGIVFFLQGLTFDLQLSGPAFELVDFSGHGIDLYAQRSRRFVNEVNGLVRQETVGDIAM